MNVSYDELKRHFKRVLISLAFSETKADCCAGIFAANSRDGVYSHGLNRFPVFVDYIMQGLVDPSAEAKRVAQHGLIEIWDGHRGAGMYNAHLCMDKAIRLAKEKSMACVVLRNNNHWMRGGTYGLMAAEAGCIGICFTNAIASMAPWGGNEPRLGNNPLVIAIPYQEQPILLDMAMSQFSYGKMQEYELANKMLPVDGGYDLQGNLSRDPALIRKNKSALPIGFWKGSGLALVLDVLLTVLGNGPSTASITASGKEVGLSQCFICLHPDVLHNEAMEEIIQFTKSATPSEPGEKITYPGERMFAIRRKNEKDGIPVDEKIWKAVKEM